MNEVESVKLKEALDRLEEYIDDQCPDGDMCRRARRNAIRTLRTALQSLQGNEGRSHTFKFVMRSDGDPSVGIFPLYADAVVTLRTDPYLDPDDVPALEETFAAALAGFFDCGVVTKDQAERDRLADADYEPIHDTETVAEERR